MPLSALPRSMRAAVYRRYGAPDVVELTTIPVPVPRRGEFLVRVRAGTVNRTDGGFRSAEYTIVRLFAGLVHPKNPVLGCEYAGDVVAVGPEVTSVGIGDRVFGYDDARFGAHAEYKLVRAKDTYAHLPDDMPYTLAAPLTEGAHYALCNLRAARLQAGQSILVNGGTGAIGSAAIQLARTMGCSVTAVCGPEHLDTVRALGAHRVLDHTREDFTALTERFHMVFDAVGKSTWDRCKPLLTSRGVYVSTELGPHGQNPFLAMVTPFMGGPKVLFPLPTITKDDVEWLRGLAVSGQFRPLVDRVVPLEDIVETYRYVDAGKKIGNVVITMENAER